MGERQDDLGRVPSNRRARFLICLYFTVLVDQAMYEHYPGQYSAFEKLTRYPKYCHGLSQFQFNPRGILAIPVARGVVAKEEVAALLPEGMNLFVDEVVDFLPRYLPEISPEDFFRKLLMDPDVQVPKLAVLLNEDLQNDVVYIAYRELERAVNVSRPNETRREAIERDVNGIA